MAPFPRLLMALLLVLAAAEASNSGGRHDRTRYARVFSFGNSLTDTGNTDIFPVTAGGPSTHPPYGVTHFGRPSGRSSDGRLIIDFIVEALRVRQPMPYLAGKTAADFRCGANFAAGGATALDPGFLKNRGVSSFVPISLRNETSWFDNVLHLLGASTDERRKIAARSFFYFGEIGVNDYFFAIANNGTINVAATLVPHIVGVIGSALASAIAAGARTVAVTGMIPLGCEPQLLTQFPGGGAGGYDRASGCIKRFNELAELHNRALGRMLEELRRAHPGVAVHYVDLYRPVAAIVASPRKYGFGSRPLAACCGGGGGPYNFNFTFFCGTTASKACAAPSEYVSWDGIHYTEAANRFIARAMLRRL